MQSTVGATLERSVRTEPQDARRGSARRKSKKRNCLRADENLQCREEQHSAGGRSLHRRGLQPRVFPDGEAGQRLASCGAVKITRVIATGETLVIFYCSPRTSC